MIDAPPEFFLTFGILIGMVLGAMMLAGIMLLKLHLMKSEKV